MAYLVPSKSIAAEKYLDFRKKYEPFGIGMVVYTREYGECDLRIRAGEFEIAVIVYEKMSQLMLENSFLLRSISILIIDDLQEIGDPCRGPGLEVTLTEIVTSLHHPQIIGLAAVLVPRNIISFVFTKSMIYWRQLNEGGCHVAKISSNPDEGGAWRA